MPCGKQKGGVKRGVSMSPDLNCHVLPSSSTPLPLWFQVWHQSVSWRVAGTGSTRQQLPVCSAESCASPAVITCQALPEFVHNSPLWPGTHYSPRLPLSPCTLEASSFLKKDPLPSPKIATLMLICFRSPFPCFDPLWQKTQKKNTHSRTFSTLWQCAKNSIVNVYH